MRMHQDNNRILRTCDSFLRVTVSPRLRVLLTAHRSLRTALLLLLTAHCALLTAHAQPGVPQPNSPLYGARPGSGPVAAGLPKALKNIGIDQKLNDQVPLDAVFKDEHGN